MAMVVSANPTRGELSGLTVRGRLDLSGCTGLTSLPDGLTVGEGLDLRDCTGLTSLPDGLTVGRLDLSDCTGLTSLPDGLTVGGWLDLSGCTSLTDVTWFAASGNAGRTGPVVTLGGVPHVALGCFLGTLPVAAAAIRKKYGDGSKYEATVVEAFERHMEDSA